MTELIRIVFVELTLTMPGRPSNLKKTRERKNSKLLSHRQREGSKFIKISQSKLEHRGWSRQDLYLHIND